MKMKQFPTLEWTFIIVGALIGGLPGAIAGWIVYVLLIAFL
jgi:hypothetical protein